MFAQGSSGAIINRARDVNSSFSTAFSGGFFLVGGNITFDQGTARILGSRAELAAIANGVVELSPTSNTQFRLSVPVGASRGDVVLQGGSVLATQTGDIAIYARNLKVIDRSVVGTFLISNGGAQVSRAGNIALNVIDNIMLQQRSTVNSSVEENVVGRGGNIGD